MRPASSRISAPGSAFGNVLQNQGACSQGRKELKCRSVVGIYCRVVPPTLHPTPLLPPFFLHSIPYPSPLLLRPIPLLTPSTPFLPNPVPRLPCFLVPPPPLPHFSSCGNKSNFRHRKEMECVCEQKNSEV